MSHSPFVKGSDVLLQAELQLILNAVVEGVCGLDAQGNATFCNDALLSMTGYSEDEFVGKNVHTLLHHSRPDGTTYPAVHTLKGSAGLIGAQAVTEAARDLEMMAKSDKMDGLERALETLDHELKRLIQAVAEFHHSP